MPDGIARNYCLDDQIQEVWPSGDCDLSMKPQESGYIYQSNRNQTQIYIAPYIASESEALSFLVGSMEIIAYVFWFWLTSVDTYMASRASYGLTCPICHPRSLRSP